MNKCLFSSVFQASVALCLVSLHAYAHEVPFPQCPQNLPTEQSTKSSISDGWKAAQSAYPKYHLAHISISSGEYPVEQTGFDVPSGEKKQPNGDIIVYHDELILDSQGRHDYWAVCRYDQTSLVLVQRIPESVTRCEVKYANDATTPERVAIKCFDTSKGVK